MTELGEAQAEYLVEPLEDPVPGERDDVEVAPNEELAAASA